MITIDAKAYLILESKLSAIQRQTESVGYIPSNELTAALSSQLVLSSASLASLALKPISQTLFTASSFEVSFAYESVQNLAVLVNSSILVLYIFATSASCGSSGSGEHKSACSDSNAVLIVRAGDHWSFKISFKGKVGEVIYLVRRQ
jgi:hypothetical protein